MEQPLLRFQPDTLRIRLSLCRSESLNRLSYFDQCLFFRLIVLADDFGRFDARPAIIKGSGFPLDQSATPEEIMAGLARIESEGMIQIYEVEGKSYLQMSAWNKFQRLRNSKQKYPPPGGFSDDSHKVAATRGNSPQVAATRGLNPNPNPNPNPKKNPNPKQNPNPNPNPKGMRRK